jgi:hypothetical protein
LFSSESCNMAINFLRNAFISSYKVVRNIDIVN